MVRPRWHDIVIALALVALTAAGTAALWGEEIRAFLFGDEAVEEPAGGQAPPGTQVL